MKRDFIKRVVIARGVPSPSRRLYALTPDLVASPDWLKGVEFVEEEQKGRRGTAHYQLANSDRRVFLARLAGGEEYELDRTRPFPPGFYEQNLPILYLDQLESLEELRPLCEAVLDRYDLPRPGRPRYVWEERQGSVWRLRWSAQEPKDIFPAPALYSYLSGEVWDKFLEQYCTIAEAGETVPDWSRCWEAPHASKVLSVLDSDQDFWAGVQLGEARAEWLMGFAHAERALAEQRRATNQSATARATNVRARPSVLAWHAQAVRLARERHSTRSVLDASGRVQKELKRNCPNCEKGRRDDDGICATCDGTGKVALRRSARTIYEVLRERQAEWKTAR